MPKPQTVDSHGSEHRHNAGLTESDRISQLSSSDRHGLSLKVQPQYLGLGYSRDFYF
jgi:hypothetical protein